jgi:hypothetical protein
MPVPPEVLALVDLLKDMERILDGIELRRQSAAPAPDGEINPPHTADAIEADLAFDQALAEAIRRRH